MASIFHYTNAVGLLGILSSKCLFATHYRYLNDPSEAGIVRELLTPIFEAEVAAITPKLIERGFLDKAFYDDHGIAGHKRQADAVYAAFARTIDNVSPFFVLSFCRHDPQSAQFQHGLLSQWRAYSEVGGFAVEFDEDRLDELMKLEHAKYAIAVSKQDDVLYDNFERLFDAGAYEGVAGEMLRRLFKRDLGDIAGKRKNLDLAVVDLVKTAPFLKHSGFHEEREYRIMAACLRANKMPKGDPRFVKQVKFRSRGDLIVPYIELFSDYDLPIKAIVVGPHPQQEKQEEAVAMMLETRGLKIDLRKSTIPYRK